jgi:hypothetical protein
MLDKEIAGAGLKVIGSGGKIGDLFLHYLNKYGIMVSAFSSNLIFVYVKLSTRPPFHIW